MRDYLIGIDIGTQGTKGCLYDAEGNKIQEAFIQTRLKYLPDGGIEQDPAELLKSVVDLLRDLTQKGGVEKKRIRAIGIDGQMAGIMGIDREFEPVTPYDSWLDTRCTQDIRYMEHLAGEKILEVTGCPVTCDHGPKILWWKREYPEIFRKIYEFVSLTCFVSGKLAGIKADNAYIDYTQLHFSCFGDIKKMEWSKGLLDEFGISQGLMPRIAKPFEVIGRLTKDYAEMCGLDEGIIIAAGCGDQAATSLGAGIVEKGQVFDVAGTASVFSCCTDEYCPDTEHHTIITARSIIEGLWIPLAYVSGGGLCLKWFKDEILGGGVSYTELDQEAEQLNEAGQNLYFIPHFSGRVCPSRPNMRGAWIGLEWHHRRGHLYRAIMESIGYEYAYFANCIRSVYPEISLNSVTVIGGGAKSSIFNKIKSNILNLPYGRLRDGDCAALGSAITAGYSAGIFGSLEESAIKFRNMRDEVIPDTEIYLKYRKNIREYQEILSSGSLNR